MKISEITVTQIADAIKADEYDPDHLEGIRQAALSYIRGQSGLTDEEMDQYPEFCHALYVLCQDMYDNRSYAIANNNTNRVVDSILFMHSKNLA